MLKDVHLLEKDVDLLEQVQRRATKMMRGSSTFPTKIG